MKESYAEVLESYLIPAEEGIMGDLWHSADAFQKIALIFTPSMIAGTAIAKGINKIKNRKGNKTSSNSSAENNKDKKYWQNTQQVIAKMKEECPEVIEKEMNLRKSELKSMITVIDRISKKYKSPGIGISSAYIKNYLKDPENAMAPYNDYELDCEFLINPLPNASPANDNDPRFPYWPWKSNYYLDFLTYDIYDWAAAYYGDKYNDGEIDLRDEDINAPFYKFMEDAASEVANACKHLKCFFKVDCGGDWDGGTWTILFKPSDEFIKVAKTHGYQE